MAMNQYRQEQEQRHKQNPRDERSGRGEPELPEIEFWADPENKIVNPELFSSIAMRYAETIADIKERNKRSQLYKFYNEVLNFYNILKEDKNKFNQLLPYIKLIHAKVFYSLGRKHISEEFKEMIEKCLAQIKTSEDFEVFKTFFEAFMGYYRYYRKD